MIKIAIAVALGGSLGALLRYCVGQMVIFPFATLSVNIVGSFLIGLCYVFFDARLSSPFAAFLMLGILGGLTTFSSFSLDVFRLLDDGRLLFVISYVIMSVVGALLACFFGIFIARAIL